MKKYRKSALIEGNSVNHGKWGTHKSVQRSFSATNSVTSVFLCLEVLARLLLRNGKETDGSSGRFALPIEYNDVIEGRARRPPVRHSTWRDGGCRAGVTFWAHFCSFAIDSLGISFLVAGLVAVALTTAGCARAGQEYAGAESTYGMAMACDIFAKGGPVMWPLLACSLISVAVTIERMLFWWRERQTRRRAAVIDQMFHYTERGEFDQAVSLGQGRGNATLRMLAAGLKHRDYAITESMMIAASEEIARMKHGLSVLDTIITMAPLLGILGTVTGIMRSFNLLGASDTMSPSAVAGGIAEALITTAAGLVIALPTLVPFNALVSKVQTETRRLEQVMSQFETAYKKGLEHAAGNRLRK